MRLHAATLVLLLLAACRDDVPAPTRPLGPAQRVVALAPNLAEIVAFVGGEDRLVGRTRFTDYPPSLRALPDLGSGFEPDLEALATLRPDLVFMLEGWRGGPVASTVERLGVPVLYLRVETVADVANAVEDVGAALGLPDAREKAAGLRAASAALTAAPPLDQRVLMLNGRRPLIAAGPGSWGDTVIRLSGARNALGSDAIRYPTLDHETIIDLDPDAVVDTSGYDGGPGAVDWADLRGVPAVRDGRVLALGDPSLLRPGPRFPEAAVLLREALLAGAAR
ncbi:MAG: helical backbone metal receptor [Pseudomonadota bacterium]